MAVRSAACDAGCCALCPCLVQTDPSTGLKVKPEDLFNAFQKLTDENLKVAPRHALPLPLPNRYEPLSFQRTLPVACLASAPDAELCTPEEREHTGTSSPSRGVCGPARCARLQVTDAREREMRADLDDLHTRHVELKTKFKTMVLAYRQVRRARCFARGPAPARLAGGWRCAHRPTGNAREYAGSGSALQCVAASSGP